MTRRPDGAWHGCCRNLGYWSKLQPRPCDKWYPVTVWGEFVLYPGPKWQNCDKPVRPRLTE